MCWLCDLRAGRIAAQPERVQGAPGGEMAVVAAVPESGAEARGAATTRDAPRGPAQRPADTAPMRGGSGGGGGSGARR